ncbi:MAG: hypothetical protein QM784_14210 [Polyangiaceae bacterium]
MTPPRPEQPIDSFLEEAIASESAESEDESHVAAPELDGEQPRSQRFRSPRDLDDLRRQLTAPRTPLLPSMDMFQPQTSSQQKSNVDTLPPMESVPPPAPFPAEPPPPRPSVVPPVRQPRSDAPPAHYVAPQRQSHAPPPPSNTDGAHRGTDSGPPPARNSGLPPARSGSDFPRARMSSAPPPNSNARGRGSSFPPALSAADEARRREAETIPADARSPSHLPPFDPTRPIPSLRVPTFAPQGVLGQVVREHENRRIGGVAFVLMVGLLVVAGAIMGISYAAKGRGNEATASLPTPVTTPLPKVKLERLKPNAYVAPSGAAPAPTDVDATRPVSSSSPISDAKTTAQDDPPRDATADNGSNLGSPWNAKPKDAANTKNAAPKTGGAGAKARKPSTAKTIDTETPLIMD